jgi:hypothetical protein
MTHAIEAMKDWVVAQLPRLNRNARCGMPVGGMIRVLNRELLAGAPPRCTLTDSTSMQVLSILGLVGSSVERHAQQAAIRENRPSEIGAGLARLMVRDDEPFLAYFQAVADRVGHPHRDSFVTYVERNGPTLEALHPASGQVVHRLSAGFADGSSLLYSGTPDEMSFIGLLREAVCLQAAANRFLEQVARSPRLSDQEPLRAALWSAMLIFAIRARIVDFMRNASFGEDFFLDVLRQYAVPWYRDRPLRAPSGANDDMAVLRDVLLFRDLIPPGPGFAGFRAHVRHVCPILLHASARHIESALEMPAIDERIEAALGLSIASLDELSDDDATALVTGQPWIAAYLELYQAQRDLSRAHFSTVRKYLISPKQRRDASGDPREKVTVVNNGQGTTGMAPGGVLQQLDDARSQHPLVRLSARRMLAEPIRQGLRALGYQPAAHGALMALCRVAPHVSENRSSRPSIVPSSRRVRQVGESA